MAPRSLRRYSAACGRVDNSEGMSLLAVALTVAMGVFGCAHTPKVEAAGPAGQITKGPCLLRVGRDRVALMWETDTKGPWRVSYGQEDYPRSTQEETASVTSVLQEGWKTAYIQKIWITDLQPGRTYSYRIVGPGTQSDVYEFHTVPAKTDEVRFIVYGDSRTQPAIHRRLAEQMMKHDVDFIVNSGDLVLRGGDHAQWGPQFFEPLKGLMERIPIYIAKGNHEGNDGLYEKMLVPPGEGGNFGIDYGPLHYFCADNVSWGTDAGRLVLRMARDARESKALWKFVGYHVPSVDFGGHWSAWRQADVLPAFAGAGIDFVMTGHSHEYERFRPVEPPGEGNYVTYMVAGGGGAPLYEVEPTTYHAYARAVYHFCLFHIQGEVLTMDAIDPNGRTFDHIEIKKNDGRLNGEYTATAVPLGSVLLRQALHGSLNAALSSRPQENRPCTLNINLAVPPLGGETKLTFWLRGPENYQLPERRTITVGEKGEPVRVELTFTPKLAVQPAQSTLGKTAPIESPLWAYCLYEFGGFEDIVAWPVKAKERSLLEWITGTGN